MRDIDRFLAYLVKGPADARQVFNPWRDHDERDGPPRDEATRRRLANLEAYIDARIRSARVMLVGEAPSHRGCRFSGIPFCSEVELIHKRDLVAREALALTSRDAAIKPQRERSAAVLWDEMERSGSAFQVVLWNAFPWHPFLVPEGPASNRRPKIPEVEQGREALRLLMDCFPRPPSIFAVGKVTEEALARWPEFECAGYVRHPSMGGEGQFREGFRTRVASRL